MQRNVSIHRVVIYGALLVFARSCFPDLRDDRHVGQGPRRDPPGQPAHVAAARDVGGLGQGVEDRLHGRALRRHAAVLPELDPDGDPGRAALVDHRRVQRLRAHALALSGRRRAVHDAAGRLLHPVPGDHPADGAPAGILGLSNTIAGLVLVHVVYGIAFTTMFFRNFYVRVPAELVKAARIDGAGFFTIFRRILLPVSLPIFMVCMIWQFTQIWNDFLFGVVFSGDRFATDHRRAEQPGEHVHGREGIQRRHGGRDHHGAAHARRLRGRRPVFRARPDGGRGEGLNATGSRESIHGRS